MKEWEMDQLLDGTTFPTNEAEFKKFLTTTLNFGGTLATIYEPETPYRSCDKAPPALRMFVRSL
jgi:hypothetical protein